MAAKRNIKGITIEISGDVTKLDKALASVDKSLKTTEANLKDVEKLLKLDPKNVELLDQKQRLLAQRVEQTADRYELLKKTMDESTASNPRYEKWEKAQASLQGQITKTEKALMSLEKEQKQLRDLGFSADDSQLTELQDQIDATREKAAALKKQMADTYEELGRPISIDQYDALQRELVEAKKDMEDASNAAQKFSPELAAAAASADETSGKFQGVASGAEKISSAMSGATKSIVAIGAAMVANVAATDDYRTKMSMLEEHAKSLGIGLEAVEEAYRRFYAVSGDAEASIEAVSNLLNAGLDEGGLLNAVDALSGAVISFPDTLKIESLADSLQETLATGKATGQYAELLERLGVNLDTVNKNMEQATTLEGKQTIALQDLAHNGLVDLYHSWEANNQELVKNRDATREFQGSMAELAEVSLPVITEITNMVADLVSWFTDLPSGVQTTIMVIAALVALISPIAGIVSAISAAMTAFSAASAAAAAGGTAVSLTLGQWLIIIAAVVAAVAGLIALLNVLFGKKDEMENMDVDSFTAGTGGAGGSGRVGFGEVKGYADGGVFAPNNPMIIGVGDNRTEREVIAPESMLRGLMREEMAGMSSGPTNVKVDIRYSGSLAQLGRVLQPVITTETQRQGHSL